MRIKVKVKVVTLAVSFNRHSLVALLVGGLISFISVEPGSETLTITTTYPSPSGIYRTIVTTGGTLASPADTHLARDGGSVVIAQNQVPANYSLKVANGKMSVESIDFSSRGVPPLIHGESVPKAGRLYYDPAADKFMFSSGFANPQDPTTWYKPVGGADSTVIASAATLQNTYAPVPHGTYIPRFTAVAVGSLVHNGLVIRSPLQNSSGLISAGVNGTFCLTATHFNHLININVSRTYTVKIFERRVLAGVGASNWVLGSYDTLTLDEFAPVNMNSQGLGNMYCADFSVENIFLGVPNRQLDFTLRFVNPDSTGDGDIVTALTLTATKILSL